MRKYPRECKALGIPYIYDPSQQIIRLSGDDLREGIDGSKMLIVNDYEFEMIRNKTGLSEEQVLCCTATLIVTRGGRGLNHLDGWQANRHPDRETSARGRPDRRGRCLPGRHHQGHEPGAAVERHRTDGQPGGDVCAGTARHAESLVHVGRVPGALSAKTLAL